MNEPGPMPTGGSQNRAPPSPVPDLRRRPGWSPYTGLQDPVVTEAARSSSDPTTTAAWYVTVKRWIVLNYDRKHKKILEQMRKFRQKLEFNDYSQTAMIFRICITNRYLLKTI